MEKKEKIEEKNIEEKKNPIGVDRSELTLNKFMDDMSMLGKQVNDPNFNKPTFHYGDLAITNYLLWLLLAETMTLNDSLGGE